MGSIRPSSIGLLGPILDKGVSLREVMAHTEDQLLCWVKALERMTIIKNGAESRPG